MLYLIGGTARCGKSTLARRLRKHLGAQSVSGDAFRVSIKKNFTNSAIGHLHEDTLGFDLSQPSQYVKYHTVETDHVIGKMDLQSKLLSPLLATYAESVFLESDDDLIIESVDLLPQYLFNFATPYKAIFLVDTSVDQWQRIARFPDKHSWMNNRLNNEQVQAWATSSAARAKTIISMCEAFDAPYFDISNTDYNEAQEEGFKLLLSESA